jgi:hypothetical protein
MMLLGRIQKVELVHCVLDLILVGIIHRRSLEFDMFIGYFIIFKCL